MDILIADPVATLAFLVSVLAAFYARFAWLEARRANNISLHNNRIEIYRALGTLRHAVQVNGLFLTLPDVTPFLAASNEAKFYFSRKETSQTLGAYFDICVALANCGRKLARSGLPELERTELETYQDQLSEMEEITYKQAIQAVEAELYAVR